MIRVGYGLVLLLLLLLPWAAAHGEMESTQPGDRSVLETAPEQVSLKFTEPVEVPFSVFKLYPLEAPLPTGEPSERDWQRLGGLAGALTAEVLTRRDDGDARADSGVTTSERRSNVITLDLEEELEPGAYVLMWRVLSIDTHITKGFVTFIVAQVE